MDDSSQLGDLPDLARDDSPLAHQVTFEELLGEVLDVTLGHGLLGGDGELARLVARDLDVVAELASLALNLDVVYEVLLVGGSIELAKAGRARER